MRSIRILFTTLAVVLISAIGASSGAAAPEGQMTWAVHVSLAPVWFDPAETQFTSFMVLYAIHDALVKPMPGVAMAPSLAESWNASADGLVCVNTKPSLDTLGALVWAPRAIDGMST